MEILITLGVIVLCVIALVIFNKFVTNDQHELDQTAAKSEGKFLKTKSKK